VYRGSAGRALICRRGWSNWKEGAGAGGAGRPGASQGGGPLDLKKGFLELEGWGGRRGGSIIGICGAGAQPWFLFLPAPVVPLTALLYSISVILCYCMTVLLQYRATVVPVPWRK